MYRIARAGVQLVAGARASFAPATERLLGNNNPAWTGSAPGDADRPGPHPRTQPMGGDTGDTDGFSGADPWAAKRQPFPRVVAPVIEGQASNGAGPALGTGLPASAIHPLGYGQGASRLGPGASGASGRLDAPNREDPLPRGRAAFRRFGIQGFNDQLQVRDRHVYWDKGTQNTGIDGVPHGMPNTYNPDIRWNRPRADLRAVNISVNPQIGSDATRNQDDLTRPYTWLGQQDGTVQAVYGGVPGLWASYGNRGFAAGIHDPSNGQGGPAMVYSGPPHGLHSDTLSGVKQIQDRYKATPQMRPVRIDRPSNSPIAGQSYSQTVQMQGGPAAGSAPKSASPGLSASFRGRGWAGS